MPGKSTGRDRPKATARDATDDQGLSQAYARAVGGGLLLGLPLLFTQEMWEHATTIPSWKILVLLLVAATIVLGFNLVSGFRRDHSLVEVAVDSVESFGIGIVLAAVALLLLGRIDTGTSPRDAAGLIALESMPIAFGASIAGAQLGAGGQSDGSGERPTDGSESSGFESEGRLFVAAGGALVFATNVAPTEEPSLLGIEAEWWVLLLLMAATFLITLVMVFFAEFRGPRTAPSGAGPLASPLAETAAAYAISLAIACSPAPSTRPNDHRSTNAIARLIA